MLVSHWVWEIMQSKTSIGQAINLCQEALDRIPESQVRAQARFDAAREEWLKEFQERAWFGKSRKRAERAFESGDFTTPAYWIAMQTGLNDGAFQKMRLTDLRAQLKGMKDRGLYDITLSEKEIQTLNSV